MGVVQSEAVVAILWMCNLMPQSVGLNIDYCEGQSLVCSNGLLGRVVCCK
jgi:hypothetical protein